MIVKTSNKGCNIAVIIDTVLTTENNIWHREINEDIETWERSRLEDTTSHDPP